MNAEEMFFNLDYKLTKYETGDYNTIEYTNKNKKVWFDVVEEKFGANSSIDVNELKAVLQQCKEFGWI